MPLWLTTPTWYPYPNRHGKQEKRFILVGGENATGHKQTKITPFGRTYCSFKKMEQSDSGTISIIQPDRINYG